MTAAEHYWGSGGPGMVDDVWAERQAQIEKWGVQRHPDGTGTWREYFHAWSESARFYRAECQKAAAEGRVTWGHIFLEEVFEAMAETDPVKLRTELVQVAAVIAAWIEAIDSRAATSELREEDLKIEVFRPTVTAGISVPGDETGVKITHIPTGKFAVCTHRSALEAKAEALKDLQKLVAGGWVQLELPFEEDADA